LPFPVPEKLSTVFQSLSRKSPLPKLGAAFTGAAKLVPLFVDLKN
jgi:hypothetical protein